MGEHTHTSTYREAIKAVIAVRCVMILVFTVASVERASRRSDLYLATSVTISALMSAEATLQTDKPSKWH